MTVQQILFILVCAMTLSSAFMVVTVRNLIHAALYLIVSLFGVAVLFGILNAGFLAVAQVVIYIGAIAILFIFTIMLTRKVAIDPDKQFNEDWIYAAGIAVVTFVGLVIIFRRWPGIDQLFPTPLPDQIDTLRLLGFALVSPDMYLLPFELASILLLAALIGAILLAWGKK